MMSGIQGPMMAYLFSIKANLRDRLDTGEAALGRRIFNGVSESSFEGPRLSGTLMAGSGDWMLTRRDGTSVVDARVMLVTNDGASIYMSYGGRIVIPEDVLAAARDPARRGDLDPKAYYFRIAPTFETGAPQYHWLNNIVAVGRGRLLPQGVGYDIFEVL